VGQRFPDLDVAKAARKGGSGTFEALGADGVPRLYATNHLAKFPATGIVLSLGIARAELTAAADMVLMETLIGLLLVAAAVLGLSWLLAERTVRRPVALLDTAQRRLAAGDLAVRVPAARAGGELGRLLRGFNDTAASLEAMNNELRSLNAGLEQRVAERTAELNAAMRETEDLYDQAPCGYHSLAEDGTVVRMNATELAWLGHTREELVGRVKFTDLLAPHSVELFRTTFAEFKRTGVVWDVEFDLVRKDGSSRARRCSTSANGVAPLP
jgi:nitrogen fixation/metabolism regulation signal transduction histidine kinase